MKDSYLRHPAILMFGPPGAGKGTVAKNLSLVTNFCHVSSGDIFRGISPTSPMGRLQQEYLSKGMLVPDEITVEICNRYIDGLIATNRFYPEKQMLILDGVPRTLPQASAFDQHFEIKYLILLNIPNEEILIHRLQKRAKIEGRSDDANVETLRTRLKVYHKQTEEVLSFYPKERVFHINGNQTPVEVFRDVLTVMAPLLK